MENLDKKMSVLDDMITQNEDKLRILSRKSNNLSDQISYLTLDQMIYIKNILSDKNFKDGFNLTFMKKTFSFFKKISFVGIWCMLVAFFFNISLSFAFLTLFMITIYHICKDKHIEYADMISRYEAAIKQYYLEKCQVDLTFVRIKKQEVEDKINALKDEKTLLDEEALVIKRIIEKLIEAKNQLSSANDTKSELIDLDKYLISNTDNYLEEKGNVLVKK